jgi:competence protein ComEA
MEQMPVVRLLILSASALAAIAQPQLPEGPGRAEAQKYCTTCHELARSIAPRQDRAGWNNTLSKMVAFGMRTKQEEYAVLLDYFTQHYPAGDVPRVNVNTATGIELESYLALRRSQAAAVLAYREKNGDFKTIEDLKKVPGLNPEKIEAKKDRIEF